LLAIVLLVIPLSGFQPLRDKIDIPFGRPVPDGDFFWNAWRTYTAFSNRTVYTAR
jgi:hypothetical protein